ncbi:HD domain-containing phosphohydrolase [Bdellovibrio sp. KM01]|uniref:HD domain-containing phosphohydrolase n=1 Tax=Bdellovibrio sp. KM01 TaxID=2748865 RepID=UPI001C684810|nr:HD domain-containing phosphohydrolase [Bdellovibrio sp. KM01]
MSRVQKLISEHKFTFRHVLAMDDLKARPFELQRALTIVVAQEESEHIGAFTERILGLVEKFPLSTIFTLTHEAPEKNKFSGSKFSRVLLITPFDFFQNFKFEYMLLLKCRAQFFDILPSDLFSMTTLPFTVFVRMPINQRIMGVAFRGAVLSDSKYQKMLTKGGFLVHGRETPAYVEYINTYFDRSGMSLRKRMRAVFLSIAAVWVELSEVIIFEFKTASDEEIVALYNQLEQLAQQMIDVFKSEENLWDALCEVLENDLFDKWRSPWVASYAAYISVKASLGNPVDVLLAGIFCDVGLLDIPDATYQKFLKAGESQLDPQQTDEYRKHPMMSLNRCLFKKVPVSESVKAIMVCVHERADEKGYPSQTPFEMVPVESSLIRFGEMIDFGVRTTMAEQSIGFRYLRDKIWQEAKEKPGNFSKDFLEQISESMK